MICNNLSISTKHKLCNIRAGEYSTQPTRNLSHKHTQAKPYMIISIIQFTRLRNKTTITVSQVMVSGNSRLCITVFLPFVLVILFSSFSLFSFSLSLSLSFYYEPRYRVSFTSQPYSWDVLPGILHSRPPRSELPHNQLAKENLEKERLGRFPRQRYSPGGGKTSPPQSWESPHYDLTTVLVYCS